MAEGDASILVVYTLATLTVVEVVPTFECVLRSRLPLTLRPHLPLKYDPAGMADESARSTISEDYAQRLVRLQNAPWKRLLRVQAVFRWNLRRLQPGFTLEIGCGIGRNLEHLRGQSVGVDTNEHCVRAARARRLLAFTPEEFRGSAQYNQPSRFDTILLAHVAEHMTEAQAVALLSEYLGLLRPGGRLLLIAPQEAGFRSDPTHVELMDFTRLRRISTRLGLMPEQTFSFPFPRWAGRWFTYNEFVVVSRRPAAGGGRGAHDS